MFFIYCTAFETKGFEKKVLVLETKLIIRRLQLVMRMRKPLRFIASRLLWYSRLCFFFKIKCRDYVLRFFPTALSASIWLDPDDRRKDDVFLAAYLKKGDIVLDIGANIGTVAIASAILTGPSGRIFAFEPHPRIYKFMNSNIRLNGCANIETFNLALGDSSGEIMLTDGYSDDQNKVQLDAPSGKVQRIFVKPLDAVLENRLKNIERIALMKIDVEGFELFVLKGARQILLRCECVYIESFEEHFNKYGYSTNDLLKILIDSGFCIYKKNNGRLEHIHLPYISIDCENILAFRKNKLE